jgi:hypothetical protein
MRSQRVMPARFNHFIVWIFCGVTMDPDFWVLRIERLTSQKWAALGVSMDAALMGGHAKRRLRAAPSALTGGPEPVG